MAFRSSSTEPPIRTCTPLSEAGESTSEMGEQFDSFHTPGGGGGGGLGLGPHHHYQQQQAQAQAALLQRQASPSVGAGGGGTTTQQSSSSSSREISKAEHDAIFGRAASTSSVMSGAPIVAHEDDSLQYFEQQRRQQEQQQQQQQQAQQQRMAYLQQLAGIAGVQHQQQSVAAASAQHQQAMALANGRSPRLMPVAAAHQQLNVNGNNVAALQQQQQQIAQAMIANGRSPRLMSQVPPPSQVVPLSSNNTTADSVSEITSAQGVGNGGGNHQPSSSAEQQPQVSAPTALAIMRRRRSNSLTDQNSGGSNNSSSGKVKNNGGGDELNNSNSSSSKSSSVKLQQKMKSPKHTAVSGPNGLQSQQMQQQQQGVVDPNDPLNYNASIQQQQQAQAQQQAQQQAQAYGQQQQQNNNMSATLNPHQMLTAMRYNSSLHSTLGGYPMGTPTQLSHPSVTLELIARDRARWEADYYNSSYGMDYGYDGGAMGGSYYGATPSFRGMSMGLGGMGGSAAAAAQARGLQDYYQPRAVGGAPQLQTVQQQLAQHQAQQAQAQASQLQQGRVEDLEQRARELSLGGAPAPSSRAPSSSPAPAANMPSEVNLTPNSRTRVFQERDYKNDRVWQEDDHVSTSKAKVAAPSSTSAASRRHTDKTSNVTTDSDRSSQVAAAPLPAVPQLRGSTGALGGNATSLQANTLPQYQTNGQMMGQPQQVPRHSFIDQYDVVSHNSGMVPPYLQSAPPTTPARQVDQNQRVRQLSDLSNMSGMGGYPMFFPPNHPYHGLMYPPTPGSMGSMPPQFAGVYQQQQHQDPHHGAGGGHWVDPHLQPPSNNLPQPSSDVAEDATVKDDKLPSLAAGSSIAASAQVNQPNAGAPAPAPTSLAPPQHPSVVSPPQPMKKRVSFSNLQIRTYETILGDNPSCSGGPSLGLGWRYDPNHFTASVDDWEIHQAQVYGVTAKGEPLTIPPEDLVLHRFEREAILLNTGYTRQDLADSVRALNKVKNKRRQTVHNLPVAFVEERVEVVKRTARRWMWKKERTRHMYDEWKKKEAAEGKNNQEKKQK